MHPAPFVLRTHQIKLKIETNLAHAGLNSNHVRYKQSNRLRLQVPAPKSNLNSTSRSQSTQSIRTLISNNAVIP